jgi:hypothetical protein
MRGVAPRVRYGYRSYEYPLPKILPVKASLKVGKTTQRITEVTEDRPVLNETLPVHCSDAMLLEPCPYYAPNLVTGILHRMGRSPFKNMFPRRKLRRFVLKWCRKNLTPLSADLDLTLDTWLEKAPYARARKDELRRTFQKFEQTLGVDLLHCKVKSFVKDEGYIAAKAARMINSREDYFKCFSGPVIQVIADVVFSNPHFIKKVPINDRPRIISEKLYAVGRKYYCTDFTSMEAHFTEENMCDIEIVMYRYMCSQNGWASWIMEIIIKVLIGKQEIRFRLVIVCLNATRMSGEMNTSLGNGFANLMIFLFTCKNCKCYVIWIFVEGDDGISALQVKRGGHIPTPEDFKNLGWDIKLETHDDLNTASFCGMVFDPTELVVVTDPRKVLASFGWCPKRYVGSSRAVKLQLLRAKGFSMAHQYNGCPMIAALGRRLVHITEGVKIRKSIVDSVEQYKREQLAEAIKGLPAEKTPGARTRQLVADLYGIEPEDQISFEDQVKNIDLDSSFSVPVPFPEIWREAYTKYASDKGQAWVAPCPVAEQFKQLKQIASFGKTTRSFVTTYMAAVC